jgi:hypothetical protein
MQVWILRKSYDDTIEGVYTTAGKARKEEALLDIAIEQREKFNARLTMEILELRELRQPYIVEAEELLEKEQEAKAENHTGKLKAVRKQRKVLLRQAEHLTYDIKKLEDKILASQRMTKEAIRLEFGEHYYWEDYYLEGE